MRVKFSEKQRKAIKAAFRGFDRDALAKAIDTPRRNLDIIANGLNKVSAARAKKIEKATCGAIPRKVLRPDIFD